MCQKEIDENWLFGYYLNDVHKKGIFPITHVKQIKLDQQSSIVDDSRKINLPNKNKLILKQAKAIREFNSSQFSQVDTINKYLDLSIGDYVLITGNLDQNWFIGENHLGAKGIFPVNCVELISNNGKTKIYKLNNTVEFLLILPQIYHLLTINLQIS